MQNYKKNFVKQALAWVLAAVMVITMLPVGVFAEVEKADWTINEKKEAEMSFWKLSGINEVVVVANAEGMKTPSINYIGTYINDKGRTVVRVSFRVFQNLATAVWHKALFKFDKDLYNLIDFGDTGTGMYKGADNGKWHDSDTYKEVVQFADVVSSISGSVNVKEQNLKNNENLVGGAARVEVPIDLVLKDGKTVADIKGQPHIQMRLAAEDYKRIFCVAGTGKADNDTTDPDQNKIVTPYNSYTFMTYIPSANNNADVNTVEDYNRDLQFYAANSYAKYNEAGGYLDVFHKQSKLNSGYNIGGENFAFRQVFDEKFASVLKPQDASGTVAEVFPAGQQGNMWGNAEPIKITESDLNNSDNSDLNPGFYGIQVASTYKSNIKNKFAGLKTVLTTAKPGESYLNGATTEFNSGLPTITRYYIDKDKVAEKGLTTDDLASFDFYSTFILDSTKKLIEYTATNDTGKDIVLKPNSTIGLTYVDGKTSTPKTELDKYSLTFGEGPYKIELRSNFKHVGGAAGQPGRGKEYEYNLIPGMTIKAGEKITFRTMKYNIIPTKVILTLPGTDGDKTIDLVPGANGPELTTPRRLNYITTYAGGSATQSGVNPDIDELFTDSQNITGRTRYVGAKIKLFYPDNTDYEFTIADQKTRTKMKVNGADVNGYTFTTEGKTGFAMPTELVKDSVIGITNTDVKKASTPSEKVFEKVQAKVTFDLNGGKLATTVKSFEGFDTTKLPGTEFAYKLQRANDSAPVVRIAPMNEKAAGDADYTPNGFKVDNYIDHNGDALQGDALELRKFVAEKPTIESTDNLVFLGWTTKKLEGTADEVTKAFEKLQKDNKIATTAEEVNGTEAYIFNDASPITKATTVYAVYGEDRDVIPGTESPDNPDPEGKKYVKVTLDPGTDGDVVLKEGSKKKAADTFYWVKKGAKLESVDEEGKLTGKAFKFWGEAADSEETALPLTVAEDETRTEITLHAVYGEDGSTPSNKSAKPTVNDVTEGDDKITGTGEPEAEIVVKDKNGDEIGKTTVGTDGTWEVTVPNDKAPKAGDKITVTQTEDGKDPSDPVEKTVKSKTPPTPPTPPTEKTLEPIIDPIYDSDDVVTGRGIPGATVEVEFPDGTVERVPVDRDGRWITRIPYPLYDEEVVRARQIESGKLPSDWVYEKVRYDDEYWRERDRRDRDDKKEDTKKPSKVEPRWTPPALNARDHFSYIKGYGNNIFGPNRTITRAEVAMIFARLSINQSTGGAPQFKDVKAGDWYKTAVDIMARQGVIKGYEDGTFRPNQPITRREFAAIAARYAGNLDTWKTFRDVPPTDWAYKLINRVAGAGWINGYEDGTFRPNNNITRAEVVAIVNRMLNRKADAQYVDNNLMRAKNAFVDNMRSAWYYYDIYEAAFGHSYERLDNGVDEKWNRVTGQAFEIRER